MYTIEQKLAKLRAEWKQYPERRKIIEVRAKLVQSGLTERVKKRVDDGRFK